MIVSFILTSIVVSEAVAASSFVVLPNTNTKMLLPNDGRRACWSRDNSLTDTKKTQVVGLANTSWIRQRRRQQQRRRSDATIRTMMNYPFFFSSRNGAYAASSFSSSLSFAPHPTRTTWHHHHAAKKAAASQSRIALAPSLLLLAAKTDDDDEYEHDDDDEDQYDDPPPLSNLEDDLSTSSSSLSFASREELFNSFTVSQLKQQLRLRGLKVSGKKHDLIDRLWISLGGGRKGAVSLDAPSEEDVVVENAAKEKSGKDKGSNVIEDAKRRGKTFIDVTAYLDEDEKDSDTKTISSSSTEASEEDGDNEKENEEITEEVWGSTARIVDDYEGRSLIVDNLSRTVVEYMGSNKTKVKSYVVASRDALKSYLAGGKARGEGDKTNVTQTLEDNPMMKKLYEIQYKREQSVKVSSGKIDDLGGVDDPSDSGSAYDRVIERDYGDWGPYSATGAQLSASEVQGVLLLCDVYGPFSVDMMSLADKIAFECQPCVVMCPDLFRDDPWKEPTDVTTKEERDELYEQWRGSHSEHRVNVDIRAAASCLRDRYGVSSLALWGTCYGGGRALEAASNYMPHVYDVNGDVGPPPVDATACVAWYPTRYDARALFGKDHEGLDMNYKTGKRKVNELAIMAIFAGEDVIPGATPDDAALLKQLLEEDVRVKDHMVKVFPDQPHGFAHKGLSRSTTAATSTSNNENNDDEDKEYASRFVDEEFGGTGTTNIDDSEAEVASLLSTAFMETYTRTFLPTVGPAVRDDDDNSWNTDLIMKDLEYANGRNVREEIEEALRLHDDSILDEQAGRGGREGGGGGGVDRREELHEFLELVQDVLAKRPDDTVVVNDEFVERIYDTLQKDGVLSQLPSFLKDDPLASRTFVKTILTHRYHMDDTDKALVSVLKVLMKDSEEIQGLLSVMFPTIDDTAEAFW